MPDVRHDGFDGDPIHARWKGLKSCFGRGVATLVNGNTTIVVTHGFPFTPAAGDIMITPLESLGAASFCWVDTYTATQFTIHVNVDPTADVDFGWAAQQFDLV